MGPGRALARVCECAAETRRGVLTARCLGAVAALPEVPALLLRRPDGSLAAFGLLLEDRPWLHFLQCGFEERAGRDEAAYLRLTLEIARHAIEAGFERLDLGATTPGPKLDLGGVPVHLCAWVRHRRSLVQRALAFVAPRWLGGMRVPPRRVFAQAPQPEAAGSAGRNEIPSSGSRRL